MLIINNLKFSLDTDFSDLKPYVAEALKTDIKAIKSVELYKKSVDARRKNDLHFCCSVLVDFNVKESVVLKKNKNAAVFKETEYFWRKTEAVPKKRPVVVGFGSAGMFAALTLARAGMCPIVIERGRNVEARKADVNDFFEGGKLNPESNVQFGEGGAGTFSDGKLNTGIKDPRCRAVLKEFVKHGADGKILIEAKPHIGTDVLVGVVKSIREEIISLGGEVRFGARLDDLEIRDGAIASAIVNGEETEVESLVLATGHSARDTFSMLREKGVNMIKKPFSVGVRIEHLQSDINKSLYGDFWNHKALSAADYKLAEHLENGRGVYTFCMCPGGEVINASSEDGGIAVNGMSNSTRDGVNANSALLVGIDPEDLGDDLLSGCELQRKIEQTAYELSGGAVPITTVDSFCYGKKPEITEVKPTVKPKYAFADFNKIFPDFVSDSLKEGILRFDRKIKGFAKGSAVLTAPETRSSSPIRIVRGEDGQSINVKGLYPAGEGAGYAGGIMSAAVDGIKIAERIINSINNI